MFFGSFVNWIRILLKNGVDRKYLLRALLTSLTCFASIPFRVAETIKYKEKIANTEIKPPPIFIIGYPRSGTTYLHHLMSRDPNLGYVSQLQTMAPEAFLVGESVLRPILARMLPKKRPFDNVQLFLDFPQEEEHAIANMSIHSELHGLFFPRNMRYYVKKYALFNDLSEQEQAEWKKVYMAILKKATFKMQGKRLILKTPANTSRTRVLLDLFPNAQFVHIYRNPYHIYPSAKRTMIEALKLAAYQEISEEEIGENILLFYKAMMQQFFADKENHIPAENLAEIKFEDLEANPLGELERVYHQLNIPKFEEAEPHFQAYLASQKNYKKNVHTLDKQTVKKIEQQWKFTLDKWNYCIPDDLKIV